MRLWTSKLILAIGLRPPMLVIGQMRSWSAQLLAEFDVHNVDWIVSYAYATRRVESVEAAKEILVNAEQRFPNEPVIPYNLACYEAQLNNIKAARQYLKRTFSLNPDWRLQA